MPAFTLTCCSTADRPKSFFDAREIPYACFHWSEGGADHLADLRDAGASLDEARAWALAHGPGHRGAVLHGRHAGAVGTAPRVRPARVPAAVLRLSRPSRSRAGGGLATLSSAPLACRW